MTKAEAMRWLVAKYGKRARWQEDKRIPIGLDRAAMGEELHALAVARRAADERLAARRRELLDGDPVYQSLRREYETLKEESGRKTTLLLSYRVTVGYLSDAGGFHVTGQGDSYSEAIAAADKKK